MDRQSRRFRRLFLFIAHADEFYFAHGGFISYWKVLVIIHSVSIARTASSHSRRCGARRQRNYRTSDTPSLRASRHEARKRKASETRSPVLGSARGFFLSLRLSRHATSALPPRYSERCGFNLSKFECSLLSAEIYAFAEAATISGSVPTPLTMRPLLDSRTVTSPCACVPVVIAFTE
jgi:hypothetical protein